MIIEIKNAKGQGMRTESLSCLYPLSTLKNMQAAGYSFYIDGKKVSAATVDDMRNADGTTKKMSSAKAD